MNNSPLISVVIPYYNRPEKLIRCVESVKNQSYKNYEIIIVDDCSETTFPTLECEYKYLRNEINKGPGASRNEGMDVAKGVFLAFLDSDDFWDKNFLKIMIHELLKCDLNKVIFAYCNTLNFDGNIKNTVKRRDVIFQTMVLPNILTEGRTWSTPACLWNRKLMGSHRWQELYNWEDYCFDISIATKFNDILPVQNYLVYCDSVGEDKLSKQAFSIKTREKSKALSYIFLQLEKSTFFDVKMKDTLKKLALTNCIEANYYIDDKNEIFNRNLETIKKLKGTIYGFFISIILKLNRRVSIKLLRIVRD